MAKFKGYVSIGLVGCNRNFEFEIDEEELEGMNKNDIEQIAMEVMLDNIEWNYERVDE